MTALRPALATFTLSVFLTASLSAAEGDAILGLWLMDNGKDRAHIEITRRGDEYEGQIVWLEQTHYPQDDPLGMGGQPRMDRKNPDPSLRRRPIVGLKILEGLRYAGDQKWTGGQVYAPDEGKSYKGKAWIEDGALKVRGYIGFSFLGRTMEWKPVASSGHNGREGGSRLPVSKGTR